MFYQTPADDIGFWYQNLKAAEGVLRGVGEGATQLERTNILLKFRESITSPPEGIYLYPQQLAWNQMMFALFAVFLVCGVWSLATLP